MTAPYVRFQGVSKTYDGGSHAAVAGLDLDVAAGEFLTLLGPSGSGKTTTLMMLAGFETPTTGAILVEGEDISRKPAHKRGLGMVFQNYALFPHMTVAQNLAFPLQVRRMSRADISARVKRALSMVQLDGYESRRPAQLSGGQQQRVAVARALVAEPDLILADEPTGNLDSVQGQEVMEMLKELNVEGSTIIMVTHSPAHAEWAKRIVHLFDGRIVSENLLEAV